LAEMNTVQEHIDELNPNTERGLGAYVIPLKKALVGDVGGTLLFAGSHRCSCPATLGAGRGTLSRGGHIP